MDELEKQPQDFLHRFYYELAIFHCARCIFELWGTFPEENGVEKEKTKSESEPFQLGNAQERACGDPGNPEVARKCQTTGAAKSGQGQ